MKRKSILLWLLFGLCYPAVGQTVAREIRLPQEIGVPASIACDAEALWIFNRSSSIWRLDLATAVTREIPLGSTAVRAGCWDGAELWVVDEQNRFYLFDRSSGKLSKRFSAPAGVQVTGMAGDGVTLWIADGPAQKVYALDLLSGAVRRSCKIPRAVTLQGAGDWFTLAYRDNALWIAALGALEKVHRLDPATGKPGPPVQVPDAAAEAICSAGTDGWLWILDSFQRKVVLVNPTVALRVAAANLAPVATNDTYSVDEDTTLTVPAPGLLANDWDPESDPLTAVVTFDYGPRYGVLTTNANGSFQYVPAPNFSGTDTFSYRCRDISNNVSSYATVTINVTPQNDLPMAYADGYSVQENGTLTVTASRAGTIAGLVGNVSTNSYTSFQHTIESMGWGLYGGPAYDQGHRGRYYDSTTLLRSLGLREAELFLTNQMTAFGLTVSLSTNDGLHTENVVSDLTGTDTPHKVLVVCAHYDHIKGDRPGGDDNASGTAGVLEAARVLSQCRFKSTVRFVNFDGEERGLYGSKDYVNVLTNLQSGQVIGVLNMDMILRPGSDSAPTSHVIDADLGVHYSAVTPTNLAWLDTFRDAAQTYVPSLVVDASHFTHNGSDDAPFGVKGFSSFLAIENNGSELSSANQYYHTSDDASDRLANVGAPSGVTYDYSFATRVVQAIVATVAQEAQIARAGGILANDTDLDGDEPTATLITGPQHGKLTLNPDGSFTYVPYPTFAGTDAFTYVASDGATNSTPATVTISATAAPDTDGDDMPDYWEELYFASPTAALPGDDADGDGFTNLDEYRAGTNPTDSASAPKILAIVPVDPTGFQITWSSVPGKIYQVMVRNSPEASWEDIPDAQFTAGVGESTLSYVDSAHVTTGQRFYRVRLVTP